MKIAEKSIKLPHILVGTVLLFGLAFALLISIQPDTAFAQAAASTQIDKATAEALPQASELNRGLMLNRARSLLVLTGTVVSANANEIQVNLSLAVRKHQKGRDKSSGVAASKLVTFTVDSESLIFDKDLNKIAANSLPAGSTVTIFPKRVWGQPAIQLLFAGTPRDLATFSYQGQLIEEHDNTLLLKPREGVQFNVVGDATTTWLDKGVVGRPSHLRPNLPLRVLGMKRTNGDIKAADKISTKESTDEGKAGAKIHVNSSQT